MQWFIPGIGVKRWLVPILIGLTLAAVGIAFFLLDIYRNAPESQQWWLDLLSTAALRFLPRSLRILIFGGLCLILIMVGLWGVNRALLIPFVRPGRNVVDTLTNHRRRGRGPRVVAIGGGGHGLSTLLRGLKNYTYNLTAVVTVADDGGSSGRLRKTMGILPPGDIRNCLAALSNDEALLTQLFQYRFADGGGELEGHSFGNLFISALAEITGSFEEAVAESGRVLAVYGRVLPASLHDVQLVADVVPPHMFQEVRVEGESSIPELGGKIRRVWLEPNNPPAFPEVIQALLAADMIVVGPGSLYTSILPNLLVPDIAAAIRASHGLKVLVTNVATQPGETTGFKCGDHLRALEEHVGGDLFELIVCNNCFTGELREGVNWVIPEDDLEADYPVYFADLTEEEQPWHHDADKLAHVLIELLLRRTGPLTDD